MAFIANFPREQKTSYLLPKLWSTSNQIQLVLFFQFCDVAQVRIIHKYI
jgi:hypothetical protein